MKRSSCLRISIPAVTMYTVTILLSCSGSCPDEPGVYCDEEAKFYIAFPADWTVGGDTSDLARVRARAPLGEDEDADVKGTEFAVRMILMLEEQDLDEFYEKYTAGLADDTPYYEHMDSGEIKIGGRKTKYILYGIDTGPRIEARLEYFQTEGNRVYIFRGATRGVQFDQFHDQFRQIAYTFRLM